MWLYVIKHFKLLNIICAFIYQDQNISLFSCNFETLYTYLGKKIYQSGIISFQETMSIFNNYIATY